MKNARQHHGCFDLRSRCEALRHRWQDVEASDSPEKVFLPTDASGEWHEDRATSLCGGKKGKGVA